MKSKTLESWAIQKANKEGLGMRYLCETYSLTEEQLIEKIKIFHRVKPDLIISQLKANDKKLAKRKKKHKSKKSGPNTAKKVEATAEVEPAAGDTETVEQPLDDAERLRRLEAREAELSCKIATMEAKRNTMRTRYQDILIDLQEIESAIALLEAEFDRKHLQAQNLTAESSELEEQMSSMQQELDADVETLAELRKEIKGLKKIELWVYNDGTVGLVDESEDISLDESGSEELFQELVKFDYLMDLRTRDILALAKLIKILEKLQAQKIKTEVGFDKNEVEAAFSLLQQHNIILL